MPSVIMPYLASFYQVDVNGLGFIITAYYFAYTPLQIFVGTLMDLYGVRVLLTIAILFCAAGAALFGVNPNVYVGFLGRFFIGCGSAFAFVGVLKVASDWLPHRYFAILSGT